MSDSDFELLRGSGNVFRDLDIPNPDLKQAKAILAAAIVKTLDERKWSTRRAQLETGVNHSDYARIGSGKLGRFTIERLTAVLSALGQEVEFSIHVRRRPEALVSTTQPSQS
jgi:predicted XRE-type DNA-binding protein